jgi:hypothetical protein
LSSDILKEEEAFSVLARLRKTEGFFMKDMPSANLLCDFSKKEQAIAKNGKAAAEMALYPPVAMMW